MERLKEKAQLIRFANFKDDDERLDYFTGVTRQYWDVFWNFLVPSLENILSKRAAETLAHGRKISGGPGRKSTLSLEDEPLMTMIRLRLGHLEKELASQFRVSESNVSRVFRKWINYLFLCLGGIPLRPEWEQI